MENSKQKKIMILGASVLQLPAIVQAKEMGLHVIAVDMDPEAVGFRTPDIQREIISTIDTERVLGVARRLKIDGIMTLASDMPMRTVAAVAHELCLVGVTEDTAFKTTNKEAMRNALYDAGVPIPMYHCVKNQEEFNEAVNEIISHGLRCIAKPADNSGSRGIYLLDDTSEMTKVKAYNHAKINSRNGDVLVEEYMDGREVSVETLAIDGEVHVIQITDKCTMGAPYFVEIGHSQPAQFPTEILEKIATVTRAANHAVGIQNGPSHTEIKVTKTGPKIVEIGARLGGDNITTHLVPLSTGVNMVKACIQIAIGEKPDIVSRYQKASAIRYFETKTGIIKSITGCEIARNMPGIREVCVVHGSGEEANILKSSADRIGFVIAQADTVPEAVAACKNALTQINIEVET